MTRKKHFHISPETAARIGPHIVKELEAMACIIDALEPLERADQARVLLMAITKFAPGQFTEQQLLHLLRVAQGAA